ncbi:uncharacterized protein LOC108109922 [Drosophila eugracilis]|uniref:uncharacterized protein LOC108109922 n=1 Tax=Drosophila eugracilis TaxID=29029 RepID=UPI0007E60AC4|nr:uncharacterized protein LOC108109922 [Drosophila eugracilis]
MANNNNTTFTITNPSEIFDSLSLERLQQQCPPAIKSCSKQQPNISVSFGRLSPSKCWLLGILLVLTIASSWPTETSAAPRKARGIHLIYPRRSQNQNQNQIQNHNHHHHQHQRSIKANIVPLLTNQSKDQKSCSAIEMTANATALQVAHEVAYNTREAVLCLTKEWLKNVKKTTLSGIIKAYSLHTMAVKHPLQSEVEKVVFDESTETFVYDGPVGSIEDEVPKIIDSVLVLEALFEKINFQDMALKCYFGVFTQFFHHNIHEALSVADMKIPCNPGQSEYNENYIMPEFGAAMETIKVFTILEHKYNQLLNRSLQE